MDSHKDLPGLTPEEKLKIENDLLKVKLATEFGMGKMDSALDYEMENEWLNYIYNFEKASKDAGVITVYEFLGKPEFKNISELKKEEIESELDRLYDIMLKNEVVLDVICEYENVHELIYKFVTEELFPLEMDDIRIPGMNHRYIYEEFHPNHKYDLTEFTEDFMRAFFERDWNPEIDSYNIHKQIEFKGKIHDTELFMKFIIEFQNTFLPVEIRSKEISKVDFDLDSGKAEVAGIISYASGSDIYSGEFKIKFKYDWEYWYISGVMFPNFG